MDADGKHTWGIFSGNTYWLGDADQCRKMEKGFAEWQRDNRFQRSEELPPFHVSVNSISFSIDILQSARTGVIDLNFWWSHWSDIIWITLINIYLPDSQHYAWIVSAIDMQHKGRRETFILCTISTWHWFSIKHYHWSHTKSFNRIYVLARHDIPYFVVRWNYAIHIIVWRKWSSIRKKLYEDTKITDILL